MPTYTIKDIEDTVDGDLMHLGYVIKFHNGKEVRIYKNDDDIMAIISEVLEAIGYLPH